MHCPGGGAFTGIMNNCFLGIKATGGTLALVLCTAINVHGMTNFYVATNGNDAWSGTLDAPNAPLSDGPVATFDKAIALVRQYRLSAAANSNAITLFLRGGTYTLSNSITRAARFGL